MVQKGQAVQVNPGTRLHGKTRKRPVFKDRPLVKETVNLSSLLSGRAGHDGYRGSHSLHLGSPAAIPFYRP